MKKAVTNPSTPRQIRPRSTLPLQVISGLALSVLLCGLGLFASRPGHTAGGPIPVSVANTPLSTTPTDNPAKQPFQTTVLITIDNKFVPLTTVPAGKRLVIESINTFSNYATDSQTYRIVLSPDTRTSLYQSFVLPPGTVSAPYANITQKILMYAEAGQEVDAAVGASGTLSPSVYVSLSGYYVNVP